MILSDYNIINDILNEINQEIVILDEAIQENIRCIRETDMYTSTLKGSESEDYRLFSPRDAETVHKDEISKAYNRKNDHEIKLDSLRQRRAVLVERVSRLKTIEQNNKKENLKLKSVLQIVIADICKKVKYGIKTDIEDIYLDSNLSIMSFYDIIQECFRFIDRYVITTQIFLVCKKNGDNLIIDFFYRENEYRKKYDRDKEDFWNRSSVIKMIFLIHGKFQYSPDIQMGNKIHMEIPL